ncbi:hypothetical protein [Gloeocapsopsis dulcis]|nr:hypothetical protein [Gloeocapsopsis dulcis]WNN91855.1 hypothetical protein P0S91_12630 [Gloeocapsopsis dulcis]
MTFLCFITPSQPATAAFIQPLRTKQAMVVSAHPLASEAGLEI